MKTQTIESGKKPSIGELVATDWRKAEVFKKYGIDFCCGGKRTVEEACENKGIDPVLIQEDLKNLEVIYSSGTQNFNNWELDFLADYIVNIHHKYVMESIPFLNDLCIKVAGVHGEYHPELIKIESYVQEIMRELSMHMRKEEMILFPYIKELLENKRTGSALLPPPFGRIVNVINMMEYEHQSAGNALEAIEELSHHFTPPSDACASYRVFFAKLQEFQQDMFQHIHLENNILFPKAIKLEAELVTM